MRKTKMLIGIVSSALCLASCQTKPETVEAEGFEASRDAFNECFEKTFSHKNMTVFYNDIDTETQWTEKILGDTSYIIEQQEIHSEDYGDFCTIVSETWCFVNENGEKIVAKKETPWSDGARYITQRYSVGEIDYQNNYKSYIRHFDVVNKLDEWIKPFTSTREGKALYESTSITWKRNNYSVINSKTYDMFFYDVKDPKYDAGKSEIAVSSFGHINPKTDLVTEASILVALPENCGPEGGSSKRRIFDMSYDNVDKIDVPDVSGWEDMTNK